MLVVVSEGPNNNIWITQSPIATTKEELVVVGKRSTLSGKPFWVVSMDKLPQDHVFFDAWEPDYDTLGSPDGYGELSDSFMTNLNSAMNHS